MPNIIYKIRNLVNGNFYVGSTTSRKERWRTHRNKLRGNRHHCKHLQAAWNKYGEERFIFEVVEENILLGDLQAAEDVWLIAHVGETHCYNHGTRSGAPWRGIRKELHPNFGKSMSSEAKAAISAAVKHQWITSDPRTGQKHTEETKALISANRVGKNAGAEHYRYGKTLSLEVRQKIGDTQRGVVKPERTEEHRRNLSIANKGNQNFLGKTHTEEAKTKIRKKVLETTTGTQFPSLTAVLQHYQMTMPTLRRALLAGAPITKGKFTGLVFKYVDTQ